jgi:hypothetical protein
LPNYRNHWLRLGFTADDMDSRADRFVDALVAWGSADDIGERIAAPPPPWRGPRLHPGLSPLNPFLVDV